MDDRTLALLGDRAAQERITERGELLPCPYCGEAPSTRVNGFREEITLSIGCFKCGERKSIRLDALDMEFPQLEYGFKKISRLWNTRAPILTPEQKRLEDEL